MDIDIDFKTNFDPKTVIPQAVPASMVNKDLELVKHPCGYYVQHIAVDPQTNLSAIPFKSAELLGYFKIDFLHLSILDAVSSKQEIRELITQVPDWSLLYHPQHSGKIFQLHNHTNVLEKIKPTTVQELADCIAIVRPGKMVLLDQYLKNKQQTRPLLYRQLDDDKSAFRRSHAVAYALTIVLQLHLIKQGRL